MFNNDLTYAEVGATQYDPLPDDYHHLRYRTQVGAGAEAFATAGEAVVTFAMHRATGARIRTDAARARPGVRLTVGLGPLNAPCEVVYTIEEPDRTGFGYGTRPGHPERGEEAFVVERDAAGRVWFSVTAFSRPARWFAAAGGPVTVMFQHLYARYCGQTLKRLVESSRTVGT